MASNCSKTSRAERDNRSSPRHRTATVDAIWARVERAEWRSDADRDAFRAAINKAKDFYAKVASGK